MKEEYPLQPWARKVKEGIATTTIGVALVGAFSLVYLFFINAPLSANVLQHPTYFGGPVYISAAIMLLLAYLGARVFVRAKFWLNVISLESIGLFTINLLWSSLFIDAVTFLTLILTILVYIYRDQIHGRIYDHSKPRVTRY